MYAFNDISNNKVDFSLPEFSFHKYKIGISFIIIYAVYTGDYFHTSTNLLIRVPLQIGKKIGQKVGKVP